MPRALSFRLGHIERLEDRLTPATLAELTAVAPDARGFVSGVYELLLDRPADAGGRANWEARLASGSSRNDVSASILSSDEYVTRNPDWVGSLYADVFDRAGEVAGLGGHAAALAAGASRATVAGSFLGSEEFQLHVFVAAPRTADAPALPALLGSDADAPSFIAGLYAGLLNRDVDAGGLSNWQARLAAGTTRAEVAAALLASPEYVGRSGDWVGALYADTLGRPADATGLANYHAALAGGTPRTQVALAILGSGEFQGLTTRAADAQLGGRTDPGAPLVVGAVSTGNRSVLVSFSEAMGGSALDPRHYSISLDTGGPEAARLRVLSAAFAGDRTAVELTTDPQSEVGYSVSVVNVKDTSGTPLSFAVLAGNVRVDPTRATFRGTPPSGPDLSDTDGDGLTDQEEVRGYTIAYRLANGAAVTRAVTSDPLRADTDGDGLTDGVDKVLGLDPRDADTDDDLLGDYQEYNEIFSDPAKQDTDGDGLDDGLEYNFFRTSPVLADTDGDQLPDGDEVLLANRNARVADLPAPAIEIGGVNLQLDVRFVDTSTSQRRELENRTVSSTLTQSERKEFSNAHETTLEAAQKLTVSVGLETSFESNPFSIAKGKWTTSTKSETSTSGSWTSSWSEVTAKETQRQYEESLGTEAETTNGSTVERQVQGARLQTTVYLKNTGTLAYRVQNLQVTAFIQDPADPTRLTPLATLLPDAEPADGYTLGPLVAQRGPLVFSSDAVFPNLVESLMANPRGLVFRLSNYDIVDEFGRNFAFTSRDVIDRTGSVVIDFGGYDSDGDGQGDLTEYHRVSTSAGRVIDTNGDGAVDGSDHRVTFDANGKQVGITLREALAAIGLARYDEAATPTGSLTEVERDNSYSTIIDEDGRERIFRVRGTAEEAGLQKYWQIITPTGIDRTVGLDDFVLRTDSDARLAFVQDLDGDRLPASLEYIFGTSDSPEDLNGDGVPDGRDTDGDGLDDRFETLIGWTVEIDGRGSYRVLSSGTLADSDGDGLGDADEAPGTLTDSDGDGLIDSARRAGPADYVTDPFHPDTDRDGIPDSDEVTGYNVTLRSGQVIHVVTGPSDPDTDGDTAPDGVEKRLGGDPTNPADRNLFADDDRDGLVNVLETAGWDITVYNTSTTGLQQGAFTIVHVTSDPGKADTDGDGIPDGEEYGAPDPAAQNRRVGTNPRRADTDGDGLTDFQELRGIQIRSLGVITLNPYDADTDNDKLSDAKEAALVDVEADRWVVNVAGKPAYQVWSDPRFADADFDGLIDGDEFARRSDPGKSDTDGDGRDDAREFAVGTDPLRKDVRVTVAFTELFIEHDADVNGAPQANEYQYDSPGEFQFGLGVRRPDADGLLGLGDFDPVVDHLLLNQYRPDDDGLFDGGYDISGGTRLLLESYIPRGLLAVSFGLSEEQRFTIEAVVREVDAFVTDGVTTFRNQFVNLGGVGGLKISVDGAEQKGIFEGSKLTQGVTALRLSWKDGDTIGNRNDDNEIQGEILGFLIVD
ncbi:hypothetical protein GobsT_63320 [Gemmata obscuriglobus]|uniref:DUF4214 domain-containing protein n=1 Tax=Gemmata obscuriglobus TaxID=114 RepID=A0A2Z3GQ37_9BACT|nr:DUF4214 domain-containing protein [Gemmata obscuriglobus]AWM35933.1 DUF4214 domain-containing protein [Gemmata obscuriglobus]QEG31510.1 hypothetical protein GobsT_63320 [Gemmata obscuriglobus]VTS10852.1 thrombospondin type 3 repeat partial : Uncharacterized protein OS=Vibrio natriegens NBRC 15636 = ATCC 14048 = DSM 759 GN=M272_14860 PE=4 SV=1: DUF4214: DUF4214: DUF4214 [Gemmata obscuriglobus UQM 2246]